MIDVETIFDSDREEYEFMKEKNDQPMKEQIEEMRDFMLEKSNSANVEPIFTTNDGKEIVLGQDLTKLLNDILEQAFIPFLAEALYNAGYRKQKEGEWITSDIPQEKYVCSVCGGSCWYYDYQGDVAKSKYCPNCGAKMKGGAE